MTVLLNTIIARHCKGDVKENVRRAASGNLPPGLPTGEADVVARNAAVADAINTYHRIAQAGDFTTPYPIPH